MTAPRRPATATKAPSATKDTREMRQHQRHHQQQRSSSMMFLWRRRFIISTKLQLVAALAVSTSLDLRSVESLQLFRRRQSFIVPSSSSSSSSIQQPPPSTLDNVATSTVVSAPVQYNDDDETPVILNSGLETDIDTGDIDAIDEGITFSDEIIVPDNDVDNTHSTDDADDAMTMIRFEAPFRASSRPLVVPPDLVGGDPALLRNRLKDFLSEPKHLAFGPSISSTVVAYQNLTDDVIEKWVSSCRSVGACTPDPEEDRVVSIKTHGISIPGLTVEWSALLGTKVVIDSVDENVQGKGPTTEVLPSLELVLIEDECQAKGARPLVWTFQKILARSSDRRRKRQQQLQLSAKDDAELDGSKSPGQQKRRRETTFITRLAFCNNYDTCTSDDNNNDNNITLVCSGTMLMKFPIPRLLQKRLFRSPEAKLKSETKMGTLISNQIEKDVYESCLLAWEENYESYFFPSKE